MKTYFLEPRNDKNAFKALNSIFENHSPLYIAVAYFNSSKVAKLILEREKKKLKTYLIVNTSDILRPQNDGETEIAISKSLLRILERNLHGNYVFTKSLGLRAKNNYQNMHHKFLVNDNKAMFGSINLTDAALNRNFELLVETSNEVIVQRFKNEFANLWESATEIYTGKEGIIRSLICPICETNEFIDFESYGLECISCRHQFKIK